MKQINQLQIEQNHIRVNSIFSINYHPQCKNSLVIEEINNLILFVLTTH